MPSEKQYYTDLYFNYLNEFVGFGRKTVGGSSYNRLLLYLFNTDYRYVIPRDVNRMYDGLAMRYRFSMECGDPNVESYWANKPCSVLEMMVALAVRMEEDLMNSFRHGDRTGEWFWKMLKSLGLDSMTDRSFDREYVDMVLDIFMSQQYEPNGKGGLFIINGLNEDLRNYEIWAQMNWYVDSIMSDHFSD